MAAAQSTASSSILNRLTQSIPVMVAAGAVMLVLLMIVPVPPEILDFLLSINIIVALVIIGTSLYAENALSFSVFPSLLLIVTLFRLSLNITATRPAPLVMTTN